MQIFIIFVALLITIDYMLTGIDNFVRLSLLGVVLFVVTACTPRQDASYHVVQGSALGTFVEVRCPATVASDEVVAMIERVDREAKMSMSIFDSCSLLSRINRGETDSLDGHLMANIELAERFSVMSDGRYDITVKPLTDAWGFGRERSMGAEPNIDSIMEFVGYDRIEIVDGRLVREDIRTQIDLNSIAKGYTVDLMAEELEAMGLSSYMVNIGGEIRCKGVNASGSTWRVGIETPYDNNFAMDSFEKIIEVSNAAIATSGNYRRFHLDEDGNKVAHTISPITGYSVVSELLSATVVAPTCAEADAAATMLMACGSEGGAVELARRCAEEFGWGYYLIFADGDNYRIECSAEYR